MILEHDLITNRMTERILENLPRTKRIIDVGPGIRPCPVFKCEEHICIEPHDEYRDHLEAWKPSDRSVRIVPGKADALAQFERKDTTVLLLDVIEHMEKPDGEQIRDLMMEFEHAVIFTPLGECPQGDNNPDGWGLNGGFWQKHRSEWHPEDFDGWWLRSWKKWHKKPDAGAILAIR